MDRRFLNPLQIFKNDGVADRALPVDYNDKNILFWHVPELIEKNDRNLPADIAIPKKDGQTKFEFRKRRALAMRNYDIENKIALKYKDKQKDATFIDEKYSGELAWRSDPQNDEDRIHDFCAKIGFLAQNSTEGRIGSHLAGLYFDFSKLPALFEMKFEDAERIVDNNLALANAACIYAAATENHAKSEVCEDAKKLFLQTLKLAKNPKVHLKPIFCVADVEQAQIKDEQGNTQTVNRYSNRVYVEYGSALDLGKLETMTLQNDLVEQFREYKRDERDRLQFDDMLAVQRKSVKKAEQQLAGSPKF